MSKLYEAGEDVRLRLFCLPYAGGGASIFRSWLHRFPSGVEILPIELPGRGRRLNEAPLTSITAMVNSALQVITPRLDKPFALFGHSMGAIIGFEVARQLRRENRRQPLRLFASGRRAPQVRDQGPQSHKLSNSDFIDALNKLNGTTPEALSNVELMELMLPTIRADFMAIETYTCVEESPLDCSITAYGGLQDHHVKYDHIDLWRAQTNRSFRLRWMAGDHFFINTNKQQLLNVLSEELEELLEKVERPGFPIIPRRIRTDYLSR